MDISDRHCHTSSLAVRCSAETAFAYLFTGTSMFDRSQAYIRLLTDTEMFIIKNRLERGS